MTIRISKAAAALAWADLKIATEAGEQPCRVRFRLLTPQQTARFQTERFKLARAVQAGEGAGALPADATDLLIGQISPERVDEQINLLVGHIDAWDLLDEAGEPLPVTDDTRRLVAESPLFFRPLWNALVDTSVDGPRGNG